jgi:hypothetical protein
LCVDVYNPEEGDYALILGQGEDKHEHWVAKILAVDEEAGLTIQWMLRDKDLSWIPKPVRERIHLKPGEHIMTKGWIDKVSWKSFVRVVRVMEEEPQEEGMNTNSWWWTRTYDAVKQVMLD